MNHHKLGKIYIGLLLEASYIGQLQDQTLCKQLVLLKDFKKPHDKAIF